MVFGLDRLVAAISDVGVALRPEAAWALLGGLGLLVAAFVLADSVATTVATQAARVPALRRAVPWFEGILWAGAAVMPLARLGRDLASGDWVARQSFAPLLRAGIPLTSAVAILVVVAVVRTVRSRPGGRPWLRAILPASLALALALADGLVLPGLYGAAHLALFLGSVAFATLAVAAAWDAVLPARFAPGGAILLGGAAALALAVEALGLSRVPLPARSNLLVASPHIEAVLPAIARPPRGRWLERELIALGRERRHRRDVLEPAGPRLPGHPDWNLILVTVDALRADALPSIGGGTLARPRDVPFFTRWLAGTTRFRRAYAQASQTKRSLGPMFRSAESFEDPRDIAVPFSEWMAEHGHVPVAVVPQYFLEPAAAESQRLLDGYQEVGVYPDDEQEKLVSETRRVLAPVRDRPFFAWIHMYATHFRYYSGRGTRTRQGGRTRYLPALRWLDGQFAELQAVLRDLDLPSRSVIVLGADHGELLGEHGRLGHAWTMWETEMRVPLAIRIPGRAGQDVDAVVGNVDLLPTLCELVAVPPHPDYRGHSLVPLLANPRVSWDRPYYIRSGVGSLHGIVHGHRKLVWNTKLRLFTRFDLARDPDELTDEFDPDSPEDRALVSEFLRFNPGTMMDELDRPRVKGLLLDRLAALNPNAPGDALAFLLDLVAVRPTPEALDSAERILRETTEPEVAMAVVRRLIEVDRSRISRYVQDRLRHVRDEAEELRLVSELARLRQPAITVHFAARRLAELAKASSTRLWEPWLRVSLPLSKAPGDFGPPFAEMLGRLGADDTALTTLLLSNIASLTSRTTLPDPIPERVLALLDHEDITLRLAAERAAGRVGGPALSARVRLGLEQTGVDLRERQALLHAIAKIDGKRAVPLVLEIGRDPLFTLDAVTILSTLRDPAGLPFLREVAQGNRAGWTRGRATKAIKAIEGLANARKAGNR